MTIQAIELMKMIHERETRAMINALENMLVQLAVSQAILKQEILKLERLKKRVRGAEK